MKKLLALAMLICMIPALGQDKQKKLQPGTYAHFETSIGNFTCELYEKDVPKTVANFIGLAEGTKDWIDAKTGQTVKGKRFFDGLLFHRIVDRFMIQSGDPTATGYGGPGYQFADEFLPGLRHNRAGCLSMANGGPNTNGSQFFITLASTPFLDDKHTIFGQVVAGMDVVRKIGQVKTNPDTERPLTDVVIKTLTIERVSE